VKNKKKNTPESPSAKAVGNHYRSKESRTPVLKEPNQPYTISSRIRPIGNSKGVILPNRVIEEAGISPDADLIIQVSDGVILITEVKSPGNVKTDLSSWEEHFKNAIKMGNQPEPDVWEGMQNHFDKEEWT
jgi:antitoxin component of MazEF toxin-antitoxin module